MAILLFILCGISFFSGIMAMLTATTIFQQLVGSISFVTSAIFLIGAAIVNALDKLSPKVKKEKKGESNA